MLTGAVPPPSKEAQSAQKRRSPQEKPRPTRAPRQMGRREASPVTGTAASSLRPVRAAPRSFGHRAASSASSEAAAFDPPVALAVRTYRQDVPIRGCHIIGGSMDKSQASPVDRSLSGRSHEHRAEALDSPRCFARRRPVLVMPCSSVFEQSLTTDECDVMSDALAAPAGRRCRAGHRIAIYLQNIPQVLITILAAWKCGAVIVPCNPMLRERELVKILSGSGSSARSDSPGGSLRRRCARRGAFHGCRAL